MLRVSISVSLIRSGVIILGNGIFGTFTSTGAVRAIVTAGAIFRAGLEVNLF